MDGPKLIFQTTTLYLYLRSGFPIVIISIYSVLLFINWMLSAYRYYSSRPDPHLILARIFYSCDLYFAVFAPLVVLVYSYYNFVFDRAEFQTRIDVLNPGGFDNVARLWADPEKVTTFRIAFNYLHFSSVGSVLIKSALNLLSLYKWRKTIIHLIDHSRASPSDLVQNVKSGVHERRENIQKRSIAAVFFLTGLGIFIYSIVAVESTRQVCHPYNQCIVRRYQWNAGYKYCSCVAFADRETSPKTFHDWLNPPDTTANLAALAKTGHLRIIQIINRDVPEFPIELRECTQLELLIMIYTKTLRFPDWVNEFSHLEFLHLEGDFTERRFSYMPKNMFKDMRKLSFVHLGVLLDLPEVPDLTPLVELRHLTLAALHSVNDTPDVTGLTKLKTFGLVENYNMPGVPSVFTLSSLETFGVYFRHPTCCNGYLTKGVCNLDGWSCKPRPDEPPVQCSSTQWPEKNWEKLKTVPVVQICSDPVLFELKITAPSAYTTDVLCGGVMYKQCSLAGKTGICYNGRMMIIACDITGQYESLRRLQIKRKVGPPCDPTIESWLGCQG